MKGDSHRTSPLRIICGNWLSNEAMKPSKLLRHLETNHLGLEDKPSEYFERKKQEHEGQKKLLVAPTSIYENVLRASYMIANHIAKAKTPPSTKYICCEFLGEAALKMIVQVPLSVNTVTRCNLCTFLPPSKSVVKFSSVDRTVVIKKVGDHCFKILEPAEVRKSLPAQEYIAISHRKFLQILLKLINLTIYFPHFSHLSNFYKKY